MASKKKHRKKHFKAKPTVLHQATGESADQATDAKASAPQASVPAPAPAATDHEELIKKDVRRVMLLAVAFVIGQIGLWYVFNNTALGDWAYRLIRF